MEVALLDCCGVVNILLDGMENWGVPSLGRPGLYCWALVCLELAESQA